MRIKQGLFTFGSGECMAREAKGDTGKRLLISKAYIVSVITCTAHDHYCSVVA